MYLLPTVSIFYVQVGLCHIFRDYDGRWQISEVRRTRHEYYGTKSSFVLPLIFADEIIFIVIVPNHEINLSLFFFGLPSFSNVIIRLEAFELMGMINFNF